MLYNFVNEAYILRNIYSLILWPVLYSEAISDQFCIFEGCLTTNEHGDPQFFFLFSHEYLVFDLFEKYYQLLTVIFAKIVFFFFTRH